MLLIETRENGSRRNRVYVFFPRMEVKKLNMFFLQLECLLFSVSIAYVRWHEAGAVTRVLLFRSSFLDFETSKLGDMIYFLWHPMTHVAILPTRGSAYVSCCFALYCMKDVHIFALSIHVCGAMVSNFVCLLLPS